VEPPVEDQEYGHEEEHHRRGEPGVPRFIVLNKDRKVGSLAPILLALVGMLVLVVTVWTNLAGTAQRSSDLFWSLAWVDGVQAEGYRTAEDMYAMTDAVVVGRMTGIKPGRVIGDPAGDNAAFYATVTLEVERVLRSRAGALPEGGSINLELVTFQQPLVDLMVESFVPERGLYFLTSKGLNAARAGESAEVQAAEMPYYRLAVADGVVREIGGRALTRPSLDRSLFADSNGLPFETVVQDIASNP